MKKILHQFEEIICVGLLISILVVTTLQVFSRYVLGNPFEWTEELARFLMIWLVFFGASAGIKRNAHIKIEFFSSKFSGKSRKLISKINLIIVMSLLIILIFEGSMLTIKMASIPAITLPITWAYVYSAVPIGAGLLLIRLLQYQKV